MARHDEKTSAGTAKMLSGGDTGDRLAASLWYIIDGNGNPMAMGIAWSY